MTSIVKIGDHEIAMTANAATCYRYKQIFKKDLFQLFKSPDSLGVETIQELAYIMMMQEAKALDKANFDNYMTWLEDFDPMDFAGASAEIVNVYAAQQKTSSTAKKKANQQSES